MAMTCVHIHLPTKLSIFSSSSSSSSVKPRSISYYIPLKMRASEITKVTTSETREGDGGKKKVFVAGATGSTGKRIVDQLLVKGFAVKAGFEIWRRERPPFLAITQLSKSSVKADVTDSAEKLAEVIGADIQSVVCATGFRPGFDLFAPWKVDNFGTVNLVEACRKCRVNRLVPREFDLGEWSHDGTAFQSSEVRHNYTIVRPGGGLRNDPPSGNTIMEPEDTLYEGSISRDQVAEVAVEALILPEATYKVVEIVARADTPKRSFENLFGSI